MNIIYYILLVKTFVYRIYYSIISRLFTIKEVTIINSENVKENVIINYYLYHLLSKIIMCLEKIQNYIDIDTKLIHVIKRNTDGETYYILKKHTNEITLNNLNSNTDETNDKYISNIIYRKFTIKQKNNDVCCKEYLIKYSDVHKRYNNTIEHILLFNNVNIIGNPNVEISIRKLRNNINIIVPYNNIKNLHINDIENLDSI